jgi:hypothetical protein
VVVDGAGGSRPMADPGDLADAAELVPWRAAIDALVRLGVKGSQVSCPVSPTERRTSSRASQAWFRACRVVGGVIRHRVSDLLKRAGRR